MGSAASSGLGGDARSSRSCPAKLEMSGHTRSECEWCWVARRWEDREYLRIGGILHNIAIN